MYACVKCIQLQLHSSSPCISFHSLLSSRECVIYEFIFYEIYQFTFGLNMHIPLILQKAEKCIYVFFSLSFKPLICHICGIFSSMKIRNYRYHCYYEYYRRLLLMSPSLFLPLLLCHHYHFHHNFHYYYIIIYVRVLYGHIVTWIIIISIIHIIITITFSILSPT